MPRAEDGAMKGTYREAELTLGPPLSVPGGNGGQCTEVIVEPDLPNGRLPTPESSANKKSSRNRFLRNQSSGGSIAFPGTAPVNGE